MNNENLIDLMLLSNEVKIKREAEGLSLRDLGEKLNISASTLSRIESRNNLVDICTYFRICDWLKVSPSYFSRLNSEEVKQRPKITVSDIIHHVENDPLINKKTRESLARMIEIVYAAS